MSTKNRWQTDLEHPMLRLSIVIQRLILYWLRDGQVFKRENCDRDVVGLNPSFKY